ncbi:hypothetical protein L226DRAFT_202296 [Lentinus tigrinus ALCF2SS1-7]|uniref:uncharacterized protein n=1 Tax=Lentinus tigrinus ALCF2SS1-7 TaxID=1328758 RepID=UPI001165D596|nr:hypothetical protein L226DRAFT_202296 [Lentinus tigrinus ALCF2SS1-7]
MRHDLGAGLHHCGSVRALLILSGSIPFFNDLLGVISSLFASNSWFTYGISGVFWFHLTPRSELWTTWKQRAKTVFWAAIVAQKGAFIMVRASTASSMDTEKEDFRVRSPARIRHLLCSSARSSPSLIVSARPHGVHPKMSGPPTAPGHTRDTFPVTIFYLSEVFPKGNS